MTAGQWCSEADWLQLKAAELARLRTGQAVLDVGCGTGTLAIEVKRQVGAAEKAA